MTKYRAWINQTWLDNLGLEMPTTPEELYTVLKAFKEQDANGNGDPGDVDVEYLGDDLRPAVDEISPAVFNLQSALLALSLDGADLVDGVEHDDGHWHVGQADGHALVGPDAAGLQ